MKKGMRHTKCFNSSFTFRPGDCGLKPEPEQCLAHTKVRCTDSSTSRRMLKCTGSKADPIRVRIRAKRKRTSKQCIALSAQGFFKAYGTLDGRVKKTEDRCDPQPRPSVVHTAIPRMVASQQSHPLFHSVHQFNNVLITAARRMIVMM